MSKYKDMLNYFQSADATRRSPNDTVGVGLKATPTIDYILILSILIPHVPIST